MYKRLLFIREMVQLYNNMIDKIKQFLTSRATIRFYRVTGFGALSVVLVELLDLIPQIDLVNQYEGGIILILTAVLNAVDKKRRDLKSTN